MCEEEAKKEETRILTIAHYCKETDANCEACQDLWWLASQSASVCCVQCWLYTNVVCENESKEKDTQTLTHALSHKKTDAKCKVH